MTDVTLNKSMPCSPEAEQMVLGCSILDNEVFEQAAHVLDAEMFYSPSNGKVFAAMSRLVLSGKGIDPVTLQNELQRVGQLDQVGGPAYVASLFDGVPRFSNIEAYVRIVREKFQMRRLAAVGNLITNRALDADLEIDEQMRMAEQGLLDIAARDSSARWSQIGGVAHSYLTEVESRANSPRPVVGFSTGLTDLDFMTLGLEKKTVNIIAARPGVGKTAVALGLTRNITESKWNLGEDGQPPVIGWFSMEMSKEQLSRRLISSLARVDMRRLHLGQLNQDEWRRVQTAEGVLAQWRCYIDDRCGLSVSKMREALRQLRQDEKGLDVLVIDYLQLGDGDGGKKFNRAEEVGAFSRGIMQMAKDYNVCVIALSQCNRSAESRGGNDKGRIGLGDLRESGQLEQDAYQVWGLYRDELINKETEKRNVLEIDILKQRNGSLGCVEVLFRADQMFLGNLERSNGY